MMAPELTCQELVELVTEYLEGAMAADEQARFEAHLTACRHCRAYLDQMRITLKLVGRLDEAAVPAPARDDLLAAFRRWKGDLPPTPLSDP